MDRLFLDANVLFSAAYRADSGLAKLWKLSNVALCSSRYAIEEARLNLTEKEQRERLAALSECLALTDVEDRELPPNLSIPPKDAPIMLAAIESRATHLLTGDVRHFGPYFGRKVQGVQVMLPGDYLRSRQP